MNIIFIQSQVMKTWSVKLDLLKNTFYKINNIYVFFGTLNYLLQFFDVSTSKNIHSVAGLTKG